MLVAAVQGLAQLAREPVTQAVLDAYKLDQLAFGKDYIVPKPLDARLRERIPAIVAKAAVDSGVARLPLKS
jgi:malate dehydrogenase (oxaloacetate-decarboxylating)(NADP+)